MKRHLFRCRWLVLLAAVLLLVAPMTGCTSSSSDPVPVNGGGGGGNPPAPTTGKINGTVTNNLTQQGVAGITVTANDAAGTTTTTAADGSYTLDLAPGTYTVTYNGTNFTQQQFPGLVVTAGGTVAQNVPLAPTSPVIANAGADITGAAPGGAVNPAGTVVILDGSTNPVIAWTQFNSVPVVITGADTATPTVTLPSQTTYKDELITALKTLPIPSYLGHVPAAGQGVLPNRHQVVGINPLALEHSADVTLQLQVTTSSGVYKDTMTISAGLPFHEAPGQMQSVDKITGAITPAATVPINQGVLLHAPDGGPWNWVLTPPAGSASTLDANDVQSPYFVPDVAGNYVITEGAWTCTISAATYWGAITGQDAEGRPVANNCIACHKPAGLAPDKFTPWKDSGHAEIFTNNLNTSDHYGAGCFLCHTVGYDTAAANNGMDDQADYAAFLASPLLHNVSPNEWTTMLADFPLSARMANIQCENCHGPVGNGGAGPSHFDNFFNVSMSSDDCAICHGEPLRHARFQQWQMSGHANYDTAVAEAGCGFKCHTTQGHVAWDENGFTANPAAPAGLDAEIIQPITCIACHSVHNPGSVSGDNNDTAGHLRGMMNYNPAIPGSGDSPPLESGFTATSVGKGAMCMPCHNNRRDFATVAADGRASHGGPQADVLMGQNVFWYAPIRGPHGTIENTCTECHMQLTDPPAELSHNLGGTNHTFYASPTVCLNCHGFSGEGFIAATNSDINTLGTVIAANCATWLNNYLGTGKSLNVGFMVNPGETITAVGFGEGHGRQELFFTTNAAADPTPGVQHEVQLRSVVFDPAGANVTGFGKYVTGLLLTSAGWNYTVFHNDGSGGTHNPKMVPQVIGATNAALAGGNYNDFTLAP